MAEIFFSYSHTDRERVRPIRDALAEIGFEVFWDQQTPSGSDWDTWIRGELAKAKCAMVFWSSASATSHNVRHEAEVARDQRKLISVLLEPIRALDLPMGFYHQQAADLSNWKGDYENEEWRKFRFEFEEKLMPRWARQRLNRLEAELVAERARCEEAEGRDKELKTQIAKEAKTQQGLKRERDNALGEVSELKTAIEERERASQAQIEREERTRQGLISERDSALADLAKLNAVVEERDHELKSHIAELEEAEQRLNSERDNAAAKLIELKAAVEERDKALQAQLADQSEMEQNLKRERDNALVELAELKATIGKPTQADSHTSKAASFETPARQPRSKREFLVFWRDAASGTAIICAIIAILLLASGNAWGIIAGLLVIPASLYWSVLNNRARISPAPEVHPSNGRSKADLEAEQTAKLATPTPAVEKGGRKAAPPAVQTGQAATDVDEGTRIPGFLKRDEQA